MSIQYKELTKFISQVSFPYVICELVVQLTPGLLQLQAPIGCVFSMKISFESHHHAVHHEVSHFCNTHIQVAAGHAQHNNPQAPQY